MRFFVVRYPYAFSILVYLALWGLAAGVGLSLPAATLALRARVFQLAAALLACGLLAALGWWREVGFVRPHSLHSFWYPVLFLIAAPMLGGFDLSAVIALLLLDVTITAFSEEALFRGVIWRALRPTGVMRTALLTAALFGTLHLAKVAIGGDLVSTLPIVVATTLGGVGYAALRLHTGSIWPIVVFHAAFNLTSGITRPETIPGLTLFLSVAVSFGFLGYGLFLLRTYWLAQADPRCPSAKETAA